MLVLCTLPLPLPLPPPLPLPLSPLELLHATATPTAAVPIDNTKPILTIRMEVSRVSQTTRDAR
jgi:hypothetical protein